MEISLFIRRLNETIFTIMWTAAENATLNEGHSQSYTLTKRIAVYCLEEHFDVNVLKGEGKWITDFFLLLYMNVARASSQVAVVEKKMI